MGYSTEFEGQFEITPPLDDYTLDYLNKFAYVRHMKRDVGKIPIIYPNWEEQCFHGDLGPEGAYFVGDLENFGQNTNASVIDHNTPPFGCPELWCQWIPDESGQYLQWDGGEKFYCYVEWLQYLIDNFLAPSNYIVNGSVFFRGEDFFDVGKITVKNNIVSTTTLD